MKNLKTNYPNITKNMSQTWLTRFEKSENKAEVERLFDYLEDKYGKD